MHGQENRMLLRHYLDQGMSKRAVAHQLGISRDTLYRWIANGERFLLQPLASRPYRPLVLLAPEPQKPSRVQDVPTVHVERRPLSAYTRIAAGER